MLVQHHLMKELNRERFTLNIIGSGPLEKKIISFRGENNISKLNLMSTNFYLFNNSEVKSVNFTIDTKTNFRTNYQVFVPKLSKKIEVIINRKIKKSFGDVQYKFDIK